MRVEKKGSSCRKRRAVVASVRWCDSGRDCAALMDFSVLPVAASAALYGNRRTETLVTCVCSCICCMRARVCVCVCVCVCTQVADTTLFQIIYSTVGHRRHLHDAAKEVPQCLWLPPQLWPPPPHPPPRGWHTCLFTCTRGITIVCMWLHSHLIQSIRSCYDVVSAVIAMLLSMIPASNLASLLRMST